MAVCIGMRLVWLWQPGALARGGHRRLVQRRVVAPARMAREAVLVARRDRVDDVRVGGLMTAGTADGGVDRDEVGLVVATGALA